MGRYTLRRLLQLIPVLLGTTFIIHFMVWQLPGDPFAGRCGDRPCSPAFIAEMTDKYQLDEPWFVQYFTFLGNLLRGDFGESFNGVPVAQIMADAWPITIRLALVGITFEILIGIGVGVLSGMRRGGFLDNISLGTTLIFLALPTFVIGFTLQYLLGVRFPIIRPTVSVEARWDELIVPGFVLASLQMAIVVRLARSTIVENLRADYVRTAVAKGLTRIRVTGVHLLRNSLIPVVTYLGTDLGTLMGGAVVTEGIFNIQGIGGELYRAIGRHDSTIIVPMVTALVLVYLLVNLIVDLLYAVLDPRIRYD